MPRLIGGCRPLPDIADHVDEPETIGRERPDRRGSDPTGSAGVVVREMALPGIGHQLAIRPDLLTPGVRRSAARSRGVLPLRLARKPPTRPARVGLRIVIRNLNHRVIGLL